MRRRKILSIALIVAGVVMIGASLYIKNQVAQGKLQVASAQRKVDQGSQLFSLTPATQEVGKGVTSYAQGKIDAGMEQISYYQGVANILMVGGIACLVVGGIFIYKDRKKHH